MSYTIPILKISDRYATDIWLMSDVHFGHVNFDKDYFDIYLKWLTRGYHKVLGIGDYVESVFPSNAAGKMMWDQVLSPKEQFDQFVGMLKPHKSKIIGLGTGNHERRNRNDTSIDTAELMCQVLDVPFLGYTGWVCFDTGAVQYYMHYHHGDGSSTSPEYMLRKLEASGYHGADIRCIGHSHNLAWIPRPSMIVNREKNVLERRICHEIRTGGFLRDPEYAAIAMYPVCSLGSPILRLHPTMKQIDVRMGLTAKGDYGFDDLVVVENE